MSFRTVIPNFINDDQTGFLKGRFIGENIILTDSIIHYNAEDQHLPGCCFSLILKKLSTHSSGHLLTVRLNLMEFKVLDATVAKTSLKIASSSLPIFFVIMSVCLTFES